MITTVSCRRLDGSSMEWCRLVEGGNDLNPSLAGTVVGAVDGAPYSCRYTVALDRRWHTRRVDLDAGGTGGTGDVFVIERDGAGR